MTIRRTMAPLAIVLAPMLVACSSAPDASPSAWSAAGQTSPRAAEQIAKFEPITEREFDLIRKSVLFSEEDERYLRMSRPVLEPNVGELLDVWYGFVGANEHLLRSFSNPRTGEPDARYLEQVRARFGQWVLDTADANFDQAWLDRQLELGLRHHRLKKNTTDGVDAAEHIHFRYLVALHSPITATIKPFLARGGHSQADVDAMHEAWRKAVLMTVILWSQPYVAPEDF